VGAVRRAVVVLSCVIVSAGCGGSGDDSGPVVARVGEQEIPLLLLEEGLGELSREYSREGREFPERGTPGYETLQAQLLSELVEQARLEEKARQLDVEIDDDEVQRRVEAAKANEPQEAGQEEEGRFLEHLVRGQLVYEALFEHVAQDVKVSEAQVRALYEKNKELYGGRTLDEMRPSLRQQLLAEKRNAAMTAFVARLERELPVRYEPGYEP
jgi:hypothetical protein